MTIATSRTGTPAGDYAVTVYAFAENNSGDGALAAADASAIIPLTVKD